MPFHGEFIRLSWNNARLLALVFNGIVGLLGYFDDVQIADPNSLFALRLLHSTLSQLDPNFNGNGLHPEIFKEIRNLTEWTEKLILKGNKVLKNRDHNLSDQVGFLLDHLRFELPSYRKLDERWRWHEKDRIEVTQNKEWLREDDGSYFNCLLQASNCSISVDCQQLLLVQKGKSHPDIVKQLISLMTLIAKGCEKKIDKTFQEELAQLSPTNLKDRTCELCTNLYDDTSKIRKDHKRLARLDGAAVELLTEQMFACALLGFVEFVDINTIELILTWQHPVKGCYTHVKPESIPEHGIVEPFNQHEGGSHSSSRKEDACRNHQSVTALNALALVLRVALDPPPWPEHRINIDAMLQKHLHQIPSEDKFWNFKYVNWVRDANLPDQYRLPRPPPTAWSPDLVAFVCLGFILLAISVCAHHFFSSVNHPAGIGPRPNNIKQYYAYAYKKL